MKKLPNDWAVFVVSIFCSVALRWTLFDFETGDFRGKQKPWFDIMLATGRFKSLADHFSNYPPLYLYFLALASWLPISALYALKTVYIAFDYVLAAYVYAIVKLKYSSGALPLVSFLSIIFLPTVFINSAMWCQCDAMYTSAMVACLYYLLKKCHLKALIALGIAFSLKPQAGFLGPLVLTLAIRRQFSYFSLYVIPVTYLVASMPALIAGRPLSEILFLYTDQPIQPFPSLTLGATNLYQWLSDAHFQMLFHAGLVLAAWVILLFIWLIAREAKRELFAEDLVGLAILSTLLFPYVLPTMHERYFSPADVFSVIYAFYLPSKYYYALLVQMCSLFTYLPYLIGKEPLPRPYLALVLGLVLLLISKDMVVRLCRTSETPRE